MDCTESVFVKRFRQERQFFEPPRIPCGEDLYFLDRLRQIDKIYAIAPSIQMVDNVPEKFSKGPIIMVIVFVTG